MARKLHFRFRLQLAFALGSLFVCELGCGKPEEIRTYNVPKEPKAEPIAEGPALKPGEATDRMLAAILPAGGQAWFFKAVGPVAEIGKHEKEINDFFSTLTIADGRANWKLPAGWKEEAGNQMRLATIVIPSDKRLELTVNSTPWPGTEESMLANVNRWRGQMKLPPIGVKQLPDVSRAVNVGDRKITIVDLRGRFAGGMTPPFAGRATGPQAGAAAAPTANPADGLPAGHPPIDAAPKTPLGPVAGSGPELPPGHPPIDAVSAPDTNAAPQNAVPKFTAPSSWKSVPAQGMRVAEFAVGDGPEPAKLTMFQFPADAGPMISDPLQNINRWRAEIGLSPLTKESLVAATQAINVDGQKAIYAPMIPDTAKPEESKSKEATLASIIKSGDKIWFVKLRGERELVKKHEDEFKGFIKSLTFSNDK